MAKELWVLLRNTEKKFFSVWRERGGGGGGGGGGGNGEKGKKRKEKQKEKVDINKEVWTYNSGRHPYYSMIIVQREAVP